MARKEGKNGNTYILLMINAGYKWVVYHKAIELMKSYPHIREVKQPKGKHIPLNK